MDAKLEESLELNEPPEFLNLELKSLGGTPGTTSAGDDAIGCGARVGLLPSFREYRAGGTQRSLSSLLSAWWALPVRVSRPPSSRKLMLSVSSDSSSTMIWSAQVS
jgi:hypothetical protein